MKSVIQRVTHASVQVDGYVIGRIGRGLVVLLGVAKGDAEADVQYTVEKITTVRIFDDEHGKMNRSLFDIGGAVLVVSQFTLLGSTDKGRRPGFDGAAPPDVAAVLCHQVVASFKHLGLTVESGRFGARMRLSLENDGPVTFILTSRASGAAQ